VLVQEAVPAVLRCDACAAEWEIELPFFRCASCGGSVTVARGNEFEVESIEVEEVQCIGPR
jgi:Zn finger protein HypA/HybF involved in hydrogenase expression